ncbi:hypothetical protein CLV67_106321 [Actinoplanes italicus]|uniref:Uncharacterized protein n=1 Tax=Actinoplanes italicus TaxID=113567 RepID=A0A2T0KE25_9ACTN|nr:hypothetical protein CLV67_106321 [Actinoplanes italicus]
MTGRGPLVAGRGPFVTSRPRRTPRRYRRPGRRWLLGVPAGHGGRAPRRAGGPVRSGIAHAGTPRCRGNRPLRARRIQPGRGSRTDRLRRRGIRPRPHPRDKTGEIGPRPRDKTGGTRPRPRDRTGEIRPRRRDRTGRPRRRHRTGRPRRRDRTGRLRRHGIRPGRGCEDGLSGGLPRRPGTVLARQERYLPRIAEHDHAKPAFDLGDGQSAGGLVPQQTVEDGGERPGPDGRIGWFGGQGGKGRHRGLPGIRGVPLDRGVEGRAEGPEVGLDGGRTVAGAFRRDVLRRADDQPGSGHRTVTDEGGQTKIGQNHATVGTDQHVVRFHVTMEDTGSVRGGERVEHGQADSCGDRRLVRPVFIEDLMERTGRHVLHDDPGQALGVHDVVDPDHVRMVETSGAACLTEGPSMHAVLFSIGHPRGRHDFLDGHVAVQHLVPGQPDPAHPAGADRFQKAVPVCDEHLPDRHRHPPITSGIRIITHRPPKERRSPGPRSAPAGSENPSRSFLGTATRSATCRVRARAPPVQQKKSGFPGLPDRRRVRTRVFCHTPGAGCEACERC